MPFAALINTEKWRNKEANLHIILLIKNLPIIPFDDYDRLRKTFYFGQALSCSPGFILSYHILILARYLITLAIWPLRRCHGYLERKYGKSSLGLVVMSLITCSSGLEFS